MKEKVLLSEEISRILQLLERAQADYQHHQQEIEQMDRLITDYLHLLELGTPSYRERAQIGARLRQCRLDRRRSKDIVAACEPLVNCLATEKGKLIKNQLTQVLGEVRKAEKRQNARAYAPRAMTPEEYRQLAGANRKAKGVDERGET